MEHPKRCPKCKTEDGMINCPNCHGPTTRLGLPGYIFKSDWKPYGEEKDQRVQDS